MGLFPTSDIPTAASDACLLEVFVNRMFIVGMDLTSSGGDTKVWYCSACESRNVTNAGDVFSNQCRACTEYNDLDWSDGTSGRSGESGELEITGLLSGAGISRGDGDVRREIEEL